MGRARLPLEQPVAAARAHLVPGLVVLFVHRAQHDASPVQRDGRVRSRSRRHHESVLTPPIVTGRCERAHLTRQRATPRSRRGCRSRSLMSRSDAEAAASPRRARRGPRARTSSRPRTMPGWPSRSSGGSPRGRSRQSSTVASDEHAVVHDVAVVVRQTGVELGERRDRTRPVRRDGRADDRPSPAPRSRRTVELRPRSSRARRRRSRASTTPWPSARSVTRTQPNCIE